MLFELLTLQSFIEEDRSTTLLFLAVFLALFLLLIIASSRIDGAGTEYSNTFFRKRSFRSLARKYSLSDKQIAMSLDGMKRANIQNPQRMFQSSKVLDTVLKTLIGMIQSNETYTEEERVSEIAQVYDIKRKVLNTSMLPSQLQIRTKDLKDGRRLTIYAEGQSDQQSSIVRNTKSFLFIEAPIEDGRYVPYSKGSELHIRIQAASGQMFSFTSKFLGFRKVENGYVMRVAHSARLRRDQKRSDARTEADIRCVYFPAQIIHEGRRKKSAKLIVNNVKKSFGRIDNLSRGGCTLSTTRQLSAASHVKLLFNVGARTDDIAVIAKVLSSTKAEKLGYLNRLSFIRVSAKDKNTIQAYVFNFFE